MNVCTRHAEMMFDTFRKAGKTVKMVLHQDGHNFMDAMSVNGRVWEDIMNEWLSHYLYGVDNNAESLPTVMAQNNTDGVFEAFSDWPGPEVLSLQTEDWAEKITTVSSNDMALFSLGFQDNYQASLNSENQAEFYSVLPESLAASYRFDLPAGTTIQGTPELHAKLDSSREDLDGLMITAVLMDVSDAGTFKAYQVNTENKDLVVSEEAEGLTYEDGFSDGVFPMMRLTQTDLPRKIVSIAWTDLQNPECGKASSEYEPQEIGLISGTEQDYTFYFQPTVYTVAEGHHLELILMTWDPYRVELNQWYKLDGKPDETPDNIQYDMVISNESLRLDLPTGHGDPDWVQE